LSELRLFDSTRGDVDSVAFDRDPVFRLVEHGDVMRFPMYATLVYAALVAATPAFAISPDWAQCHDIETKAAADQARAACDRILNDRSEAPNYAMALRNRCMIDKSAGDYDQGIADCNQAIKMEPKSSIGYERRGDIWYLERNYDRAIADFDQAILFDPNNAFAIYSRGLSRRARGENALGDADIAHAKQLRPDIDK
jgi:tetratricopeptide (TPR) repeat protein